MTGEFKATAYVSSSLIPSPVPAALDALVEQARVRNLRNNVTGVLLFSGEYFAQYLEGAPADVRQIMANIRADTRHTNVFVFLDEPIEQRSFAGWSLAFNGSATYIDRKLEQLAATKTTAFEFEGASKSVLQLFTEFGRP